MELSTIIPLAGIAAATAGGFLYIGICLIYKMGSAIDATRVGGDDDE